MNNLTATNEVEAALDVADVAAEIIALWESPNIRYWPFMTKILEKGPLAISKGTTDNKRIAMTNGEKIAHLRAALMVIVENIDSGVTPELFKDVEKKRPQWSILRYAREVLVTCRVDA